MLEGEVRVFVRGISKFLWLCSFKKEVYLLALLVGGCTQEHGCLLAGQSRMVIVDFYFGRAMPRGGAVRDAEWERFAATEITPRFPAGFTVFDARGQWMSLESGKISREASRVLRVAVLPGGSVAERVEAVAAAYRRRFHQEAVGVVSSEACGRF